MACRIGYSNYTMLDPKYPYRKHIGRWMKRNGHKYHRFFLFIQRPYIKRPFLVNNKGKYRMFAYNDETFQRIRNIVEFSQKKKIWTEIVFNDEWEKRHSNRWAESCWNVKNNNIDGAFDWHDCFTPKKNSQLWHSEEYLAEHFVYNALPEDHRKVIVCLWNEPQHIGAKPCLDSHERLIAMFRDFGYQGLFSLGGRSGDYDGMRPYYKMDNNNMLVAYHMSSKNSIDKVISTVPRRFRSRTVISTDGMNGGDCSKLDEHEIQYINGKAKENKFWGVDYWFRQGFDASDQSDRPKRERFKWIGKY